MHSVTHDKLTEVLINAGIDINPDVKFALSEDSIPKFFKNYGLLPSMKVV